MNSKDAQNQRIKLIRKSLSRNKQIKKTVTLKKSTGGISPPSVSPTSFYGLGISPIGFNESDYFLDMWKKASNTMDIYEAQKMLSSD